MTRKKRVLLLICSGFLASLIGCSHKSVQSQQSNALPNEQLTRDGIRKDVESHVNDVQTCYAQILNDEPQSQGQIIVQWTIGAGGKVVDAGIKSTELHSPKLEDCIVAKVKTWTFPAPPTGQLQVISYPFLFRAVD
jgi:hypothetical protein